MSLSTRCPSCDTQFKLVADQLKISHGWVRCGHCAEVFDASQRLIELNEDQLQQRNGSKALAGEAARGTERLTPKQSRSAATEPSRSTNGANTAPTQSVEWSPQPMRQDRAQTAPSPLHPNDDAEDLAPSDDLARELQERVARANDISRWPAGPGNSRLDVETELEWSGSRPQLMGDDSAAFGTSKIGSDDDNDDEALHSVSFLRKARRQAFWHHGGVRAGLALLCVGLTGLLAAQWVIQQRDRLAALHPPWQPYLAGLCELAYCQIGPLRQIESIAIDSSSFSKASADAQQETYRLNVVIKNTAALPLAAPTLELTLTDTRDSPALRRSLPPSDWNNRSGAVLAAHGEQVLNLNVVVRVGAEGLSPGRVAGYRLLAYYP